MRAGSVIRRSALPWLCLLATCALLVGGSARADAPDFSSYNPERALAYSQAALGRELGSHKLVDRNGQPVDLANYRGKPLVISLVYTSCYHTCPILTRNLARVVPIARDALGDDSFRVVTIGFDAAVDTPQRMAEFAREQDVAIADWDFLSGDMATINDLSKDLGFIFFPSPKGFDHLAQITIIDAQGHIYRQIYGNSFETPQFVEPLKELVFGTGASLPVTVDDWISNVRLFCTIYDPSTGRYRFDYSPLVSVAVGILCFSLVLAFVVHAWRAGNRQRPAS